MPLEFRGSQASEGPINPRSGVIDVVKKQAFTKGNESIAVKIADFEQKQSDSWKNEAYKKMEANLGELKLLCAMFQKNFGDGKALPSSFKPSETFSKFIQSYNDQRDKYAKELPRLNVQIDAYNKNLAEGASKLQKLELPPKLEVLKPRSSAIRDRVKGPEKRSSGSSWDACKSVDSTKFLKLCKTALVAVLLASCPTDAVKIQGKDCSIESRLSIYGDSPDLAPLAYRLRKQFDKVMPELLKQFAADPCDKSYENIILSFTKLPKNVIARSIRKQNILFDPNQRAVISSEGVISSEVVLTHELTHLAQDYPYSTGVKNQWLGESIAEYARNKFGPVENKDQLAKDRYFLLWLEQNKRGDIVDKLHRRMQKGTFTNEDFLHLTGQSLDELWKEYNDGVAKSDAESQAEL